MSHTSQTDSVSADQISSWGRRFLIGWSLALVVLGGGAGAAAVVRVYRHKQHTVALHRTRMDAVATEAGKTQADTTAIAGAKEAVKVRVGLYVDRIVELSIKDSTWTVDFYIWFNWTGNDLTPGETFQVVNGQIESKEKLEEIARDRDHYALYRVVAKITKAFDAARFPTDDHLLTIHIEDKARQFQEVLLVPDAENSSISSRVSVPGYEIAGTELVSKPHSYKTTRGDPRLPAGFKSTYSQFVFGISIRRPDLGFFSKLFVALYIAVAIAMLAFFIKPTNVDPRFGLGVGGLFAAIANSYVTSSLVPDTGVLTLADMVNQVAIATILLTLLESTISLYILERLGAESLSRQFDRVSTVLFAVGYAALNIALPLVAAV
jgi:hypothetical protein